MGRTTRPRSRIPGSGRVPTPRTPPTSKTRASSANVAAQGAPRKLAGWSDRDRRSCPKPREQLLAREFEETVLIGSDLVEIHVVVARIDVLLDPLQVSVCVRAAGDRLGDLVLGDALDEIRELGRIG